LILGLKARDGFAAILRPEVFAAAADAFLLARQAQLLLDDPLEKQAKIENEIAVLEREVARLRGLQRDYAGIRKGTTNGNDNHLGRPDTPSHKTNASKARANLRQGA
jgi:hypothetical protein